MFIKVGNHFINTDHVKTAIAAGDSVALVVDNFDPGSALNHVPAAMRPVLLFKGPHADQIREALEYLAAN